MRRDARIYVAGHRGLIGSALVRRLQSKDMEHVIVRTRDQMDLLERDQVRQFFREEKPEYVFLAAGKTGGLYANDTYRADIMYENLIMQAHVIHEAFLAEVRKLAFFACSCAYPKMAPQPLREDFLFSGSLEPTTDAVAVAKLAGVKMCESYNRQYGCDFVSIIPTNVYGLNQVYTPFNCTTMVPSLLARFHAAKVRKHATVPVWGSGRPSRDFLFGDDLADAAIFLMDNYVDSAPINVGTGADITVREAAEAIREIVGYPGDIVYDTSRPDGPLTRLQDISRLSGLGWKPRIGFAEGLRQCYADFLENHLSALDLSAEAPPAGSRPA